MSIKTFLSSIWARVAADEETVVIWTGAQIAQLQSLEEAVRLFAARIEGRLAAVETALAGLVSDTKEFEKQATGAEQPAAEPGSGANSTEEK